MKSNIILVRAGGVFHLLCAILHLFFPAIFNWDMHLSSLSGAGYQIVSVNLYIMNWCMAALWIMLGILPLAFPASLTGTDLGKTMLSCISVFWIIRIFVLQPLYVGFSSAESIITAVVFFSGLLLFLIPLIRSLRINGST